MFRWLDREIYFDINDFDEAIFWPIHRDLTRLLCSIAVIRDELGESEKDMREYITLVYNQYIALMMSSSAGGIYPPSATELDIDQTDIDDSIKNQRKFVRSVARDNVIKLDNEFTQLDISDITMIKSALAPILKSMSNSTILDISRHVSGNASLWLERYMILVENDTSEHKYLLNLKQSVDPVCPTIDKDKHHRDTDAQRIVSIQKIMQDTSPLWLTSLVLGEKSYVLKEIQPSQNNTDISDKMSWKKRKKIVSQMMYVLVATQIRSSDIIGSYALADLLEYAQSLSWDTSMIDIACDYVQINTDYHKQLQQELGN